MGAYQKPPSTITPAPTSLRFVPNVYTGDDVNNTCMLMPLPSSGVLNVFGFTLSEYSNQNGEL